jgi:hypothetical protein
VLFLLLVAAIVGVAYRTKRKGDWRNPWRKSRIKILGKDKIIISRESRNCPACKKVLAEGALTAICSVNAAHEIHKACRVLVKGKCPICGHALL